MNEAGKEAVWLQRILKKLRLIKYLPSPILIYKDNQETIALAENPKFHCQIKHIDIRYHWVRNTVLYKLITLEYISTVDQAAEDLTRALQIKAF